MLDLKELRLAIREMKQGDKLHVLLRSELSKIDWFVLNFFYRNIGFLKLIIQSMNRWDKTYKLIQSELSKIGHWRNKERGNPRKGYDKSSGFGRNKGDI